MQALLVLNVNNCVYYQIIFNKIKEDDKESLRYASPQPFSISQIQKSPAVNRSSREVCATILAVPLGVGQVARSFSPRY